MHSPNRCQIDDRRDAEARQAADRVWLWIGQGGNLDAVRDPKPYGRFLADITRLADHAGRPTATALLQGTTHGR